jgi:uncharacterized membrane protein
MPDDTSTAAPAITVRNAFFSGLLLVAPLVVTVWAFTTIIELVGGKFHPLFIRFLPENLRDIEILWKVIATLIVLILVTGLGYLSHYVFGKLFFEVGGRFIQSIPGVGAVYNTVKQIVDTFSTQNRNLFNKVVLIEYPRKQVWTLAFLTSKQPSEVQDRIGVEVWTVFVPTTPNPTSGFLLMLPRTDIIELEMSVGDGMKMVISGGAVTPPWPVKKEEIGKMN